MFSLNNLFIKSSLLFIICGFFITACTPTPAVYQETRLMFNTVFTLQAYGENAKEAVIAAFKRGEEIEKLMSAHIIDSDITLVNRLGINSPYPVSDETFFVVQKAIEFASLSDGAFDPAIGHLVDLWSIGTETARIPLGNELEPYIAKELYKYVILDGYLKTVTLTDASCKLDLGGIAKGYAADEMKRVLEEEFSISSGLLNLGGNVFALGTKPEGTLWQIGIKDPHLQDNAQNIVAKVTVADKTIVTSGPYERFFIENDKVYHHIIDPKTGYPADNDIISVTIIGDNSLEADALSTAVFVLGKDKGLELINTLEGIETIIITNDNKIYTSDGVNKNLFLLLNREDYTYEER